MTPFFLETNQMRPEKSGSAEEMRSLWPSTLDRS